MTGPVTEPPPFTPSEPGTSEQLWRTELSERVAPELDLGTHLVVVSAHPDDETLGCGGLIHHASAAGVAVTVVLATWGEASHPHSPTTSPARIVERRRAEMTHALECLAAGSSVPISLVAVKLPDGRLNSEHDRLTAAIVETVASPGRQTLILAPWRHDGHPDHTAAALAASAAAARTDSRSAEYPIWFWHWGTPAQFAEQQVMAHRLSAEDEAAKTRAVDAHRSQINPLSEHPADAPILPAHIRSHFERSVEWFVTGPAPRDYSAFEPLHAAYPDPWDIDSAYERRKRRATIAIVEQDAPFDRVLEIGCSVGALTAELAAISAQVDAVEPSPTAHAAARRATAHTGNVSIIAGAAPSDIPTRQYDLAVLSEVGYFLSPADLGATLDVISERIAPSGYLLACHWRHPIDGWPLDGPAVHRAIESHPMFTRVRSAPSKDYDLTLWRRR